MSGSEPIARRAARLLVVDGQGRVLMFRGHDPLSPEVRYWFTAGGGVEGDETIEACAVRELAEETGLVLSAADLGEPVWHDTTEFPFDGVTYRQEQVWFLVRVPAWEVDESGFNDVEKATVDGHRWWSAADFADPPEPFYPANLPDLVRGVTS